MVMINNGWSEQPILGNDPVSRALVASGSKTYIKGLCRVIFTPVENHPDGLWSHASITHPKRYPYWDEILDVRYTFFNSGADVFQVLPPKLEYVNLHKNCFHLWSPIGRHIIPR